MKYIPRHTHSIEIEFLKKEMILFRATFPLKERINISNWYKITKTAVSCAYKIPLWQVRGKHKKIESAVFDRIIFEWAGGISIDLPDNVIPYDYKIILHYLEGLRMAINPQRETKDTPYNETFKQ